MLLRCFPQAYGESAERSRTHKPTFCQFIRGAYVSIQLAYTYPRSSDFQMRVFHRPLFRSSSHLIVASRARNVFPFSFSLDLSLSLFLSFSLFACASHGSIIRYVSNFRPPEFFIRLSRVVPRQRCAKISRGVDSFARIYAIFPLEFVFIHHQEYLNFSRSRMRLRYKIEID